MGDIKHQSVPAPGPHSGEPHATAGCRVRSPTIRATALIEMTEAIVMIDASNSNCPAAPMRVGRLWSARENNRLWRSRSRVEPLCVRVQVAAAHSLRPGRSVPVAAKLYHAKIGSPNADASSSKPGGLRPHLTATARGALRLSRDCCQPNSFTRWAAPGWTITGMTYLPTPNGEEAFYSADRQRVYSDTDSSRTEIHLFVQPVISFTSKRWPL